MSPLFIYKTLRYYIIYTLIFTCKYSCKMNNIYYSILKRILKRFLAKNGDSGDRTLVRICLRIFLMRKIVVCLASVMSNKISFSFVDKLHTYIVILISQMELATQKRFCCVLGHNSHDVTACFFHVVVLF